MEFEVVVPVDFNFDSVCSSPYLSAPSSPQRFGNFFFSAPTSPSRTHPCCRNLNHLGFSGGLEVPTGSVSAVQFKWDEKSGVSEFRDRCGGDGGGDEDFEFNFSGQLDRHSLSADELFDGGKIKPLKPPPWLQSDDLVLSAFPPFPRSPRTKISCRKTFAEEPLDDPFEESLGKTPRNGGEGEKTRGRKTNQNPESNPNTNPSKFIHKESRSLSLLRVSQIMVEEEDDASANKRSSLHSSILSSISFQGCRKWRLKDFLLFRSASEGRATEKDNLRKYETRSKKSPTEEVKNSSFRSTDSDHSVPKSRRSSRVRVSAHELHYTAKRAVAEEMKRKTFLPYKQGLLGCLGFNPSINHISTSIGSLTRG